MAHWPPLVAVGRISYGVYLWQQLFIGPRIHGFVGIRTFPLSLLATFVVAGASYWCLERPILKLKDRYFQKLPDEGNAVRSRLMLARSPASSPAAGTI